MCSLPNSFHTFTAKDGNNFTNLWELPSLKQNVLKFPTQFLLAASAFEVRCDAEIFKAGFVQSKAAYYTVCSNKSGSLLPFLEQQQSQAFMCHQSPPNRQKHKEGKRRPRRKATATFRIETARKLITHSQYSLIAELHVG